LLLQPSPRKMLSGMASRLLSTTGAAVVAAIRTARKVVKCIIEAGMK
jgi:hypothetical protein